MAGRGKWKAILRNNYHKPETAAAFGSPAKLQIVLRKLGYKVTRKAIENELSQKESYALHRPVSYKFKRNKMISNGVGYAMDTDLADVQNLKEYNEPYTFLLICVDIFSRKAYVQPLKNKTAASVVDGFKQIFARVQPPVKLRSDSGGEYVNKTAQKYFKQLKIQHYVTHNEVKANFSEVFIRTLKSLMYRYFTHKQTYVYKDVLQKIVAGYNKTPHGSLPNNMSPDQVNASNQNFVWDSLYVQPATPKRRPPFKFKPGDYVRLSFNRRIFRKGYEQTWSREFFVIRRRYYRQNKPIYVINDYSGERVLGTFYQSELYPVKSSRKDLFLIEEILKKRKRGGVAQSYVSWKGWPAKYSSWVNDRDIRDA